jgi:hypothetical protein
MFRAINMLPLKLNRRHPHILGNPNQIALRQINKPLLLATIRTPRLAFKSQARH